MLKGKSVDVKDMADYEAEFEIVRDFAMVRKTGWTFTQLYEEWLAHPYEMDVATKWLELEVSTEIDAQKQQKRVVKPKRVRGGRRK